MRHLVLSLLLFASSLMADYVRQPIDAQLLRSHTKIIDIRTPEEWKTTGLVKGSIPIMFFDAQGNYNLNAFLAQLNQHIQKGERFALLCNSGSRSQVVGNYLGKQLGYRVIDLEGGIQYAIAKKMPLEPYRP